MDKGHGERGELIRDDVVVTWQQVGGIEPTPFKVSIPAGCWVSNFGLHVENFRRCGVKMTVDLGEGAIALSIKKFNARLLQQATDRTGVQTAQLGIRAVFTDTDQEPAILGALGGAGVEIVIGVDRGTSLPLSIQSVSGIEPIPF